MTRLLLALAPLLLGLFFGGVEACGCGCCNCCCGCCTPMQTVNPPLLVKMAPVRPPCCCCGGCCPCCGGKRRRRRSIASKDCPPTVPSRVHRALRVTKNRPIVESSDKSTECNCPSPSPKKTTDSAGNSKAKHP